MLHMPYDERLKGMLPDTRKSACRRDMQSSERFA